MKSTQTARLAVSGSAILVAILCCLAWSALPALSSNPFLRIVLWAGIFGSGLILIFAFPLSWRGAKEWIGIIGLALVLRVCLLPAAPSDDIYRYLWEGKLLRSGLSPYAQTADSPALRHLRDAYWQKINHKDRTTIYPPGLLVFFAAVGFVSYTPMALKLAFVAADLALIILLLAFLGHRQSPQRWAWLYALNPVSLIGIAAEGHADGLMMLAVLAAVYVCVSNPKRSRRAWLLLGIATQLKIVAFLLIPIFWATLSARRMGWFFATVLVPTLPFLINVPEILKGIWSFGGETAFNGSVHSLLTLALGTRSLASLICGLLLMAWIALIVRRRLDVVRGSLASLGGLILFSSIVHFWYLLWILPFLALVPSVAWLYLTGAHAFYFLVWHQESVAYWGLPSWAQTIIWVPFFLLFAVENRHAFRSRVRSKPELEKPNEALSVAVLIPTLNAGDHLEACLKSVNRLTPPANEIFLIDGGSHDATLDISRSHQLQVVRATGGRGGQIRAGFDASNSDVILILHADSQLPPESLQAIRRHLMRHPDCPGGCLGQRFISTAPRLLLIEMLNEWRATFHGTSFGDQAQFFRRDAASRWSEFPDPPLMEDVELSAQLIRTGHPAYLAREVMVSADRWHRAPFKQRFKLVIELMIAYHWHWRNRRRLAAQLFEKYYGRKPDEKPHPKD